MLIPFSICSSPLNSGVPFLLIFGIKLRIFGNSDGCCFEEGPIDIFNKSDLSYVMSGLLTLLLVLLSTLRLSSFISTSFAVLANIALRAEMDAELLSTAAKADFGAAGNKGCLTTVTDLGSG